MSKFNKKESEKIIDAEVRPVEGEQPAETPEKPDVPKHDEPKMSFVDRQYKKYCEKRDKKAEKKAEKQEKKAEKAKEPMSTKKKIGLGAAAVIATAAAAATVKAILSSGADDSTDEANRIEEGNSGPVQEMYSVQTAEESDE